MHMHMRYAATRRKGIRRTNDLPIVIGMTSAHELALLEVLHLTKLTLIQNAYLGWPGQKYSRRFNDPSYLRCTSRKGLYPWLEQSSVYAKQISG